MVNFAPIWKEMLENWDTGFENNSQNPYTQHSLPEKISISKESVNQEEFSEKKEETLSSLDTESSSLSSLSYLYSEKKTISTVAQHFYNIDKDFFIDIDFRLYNANINFYSEQIHAHEKNIYDQIIESINNINNKAVAIHQFLLVAIELYNLYDYLGSDVVFRAVLDSLNEEDQIFQIDLPLIQNFKRQLFEKKAYTHIKKSVYTGIKVIPSLHDLNVNKPISIESEQIIKHSLAKWVQENDLSIDNILDEQQVNNHDQICNQLLESFLNFLSNKNSSISLQNDNDSYRHYIAQEISALFHLNYSGTPKEELLEFLMSCQQQLKAK